MTRLLVTLLAVLVAVNFIAAPLRAAQLQPCAAPAAHLSHHHATAASDAVHDDVSAANPGHSEHRKSADSCAVACAAATVGLRSEPVQAVLAASAGIPFDHLDRSFDGCHISPEIDPPRPAV